jgi:hypothetical protein
VSSVPLLNFLDYQLVGVKIQADEAFDADRPGRAQIDASFAVHRHISEPQKFMISLVCRVFRSTKHEDQPVNLPYRVEIGLTGEFFSAVPLAPDGIEGRVVNNALSLLYGVGRGIVGQATGGGVNGRFVLPTITFDSLIEQAAMNPESQVKADPAPPKPKNPSRKAPRRKTPM